MVCGVHNMSAVESGRTNASALVAALHGSAEFRKDMDAASTATDQALGMKRISARSSQGVVDQFLPFFFIRSEVCSGSVRGGER